MVAGKVTNESAFPYLWRCNVLSGKMSAMNSMEAFVNCFSVVTEGLK